MDNDDVVHNTFVERIQKDIKKENSIILSYENGLQYDIRSKEILKYQDRQNHFLSLYTKKGGNHHILLYDHTHIFQMTKTKKLQIQVEKTAPMWVEIITENNFSNAMHWRFSTILVPFQIKEEFALLDINYKTKAGWLWEMITGAFKVFFYRGRGLINMVWGNKENR